MTRKRCWQSLVARNSSCTVDADLSCIIQYLEIVLSDKLIYERSNNVYDSIMPILLQSKEFVE